MKATGRQLAAVFFALMSPTILVNPLLRAESATTRPAATQPDTDKTVLTTKHYVVTIIDDREEGDVTSDSIVYLGVSKRTGKSIRLVGSTWHNTDPTGAPGQMYGYIFKNGDTYYCVYLSGTLEIRRKNWDIVVSEDGRWNNGGLCCRNSTVHTVGLSTAGPAWQATLDHGSLLPINDCGVPADSVKNP